MTIKKVDHIDGGSGKGTIERSGFRFEVKYAFDLKQEILDAGHKGDPNAELPGLLDLTVHISGGLAKQGDILTISDDRKIELGGDFGGGVFNGRGVGPGWPRR